MEFIQQLGNPKQARVLRNLCEWDNGRFGDLSPVSENHYVNLVDLEDSVGLFGFTNMGTNE